MADDELEPNEAALAAAARHALHDEELVAAFAAGSLDVQDDAAEIERARSFVDRCSLCRDLHRDLAAIGAALRVESRGTMAAPRDFRLSVEDARRLGGPVRVGGFVAALRRSMVSFGRPVGASMAALGIVGLLVGTVSFGGGSASTPTSAGANAGAATTAPAQIQTDSGPGNPKSTDLSFDAGPLSSAAPSPGIGGERTNASDSGAPSPTAWLLGGSVVLVLGGLVLLVIAIQSGRGGEDRGHARTRNS